MILEHFHKGELLKHNAIIKILSNMLMKSIIEMNKVKERVNTSRDYNQNVFWSLLQSQTSMFLCLILTILSPLAFQRQMLLTVPP